LRVEQARGANSAVGADGKSDAGLSAVAFFLSLTGFETQAKWPVAATPRDGLHTIERQASRRGTAQRAGT
jgi:hypothetical protein